MTKEAKNIAKWIEAGKSHQKKCKTAKEAREIEAGKKKQVTSEREFQIGVAETLEKIQQSLEQPRNDAMEANSRPDGRSVSVGNGGVVLSLGAQAVSKEEAQLLRDADKAASKLENLYARTYTDVLLATGKGEGWSAEEVEKARKAASLQFKTALPRCGFGDQRDIFITCIMAGHALGVFDKKDVSLFLYGAQVMATGRKPR